MKRWHLAGCAALWVLVPAALAQPPAMTAHFIDVGQAHATLLEFPCGAMLVDAGADDEHENALVEYLKSFFDRRTDLNRTLDVVLITHNHIDHTRSLREVVQEFTVKRYFDNGFTAGRGTEDPNWVKEEVAAGRLTALVREIGQGAVASVSGRTGLTDLDIDPFDCGEVDPRVRILAGRQENNPGWTEEEFGNPNNHSLVTRVDFRQASFLFTGDLQEEGIEALLAFYGGGPGGVLDTDVLQVGHHGSHNATTRELLDAVTPTVAVIPVGRWTFGQGSSSLFTTFAYGHPRADVVTLLASAIARKRAQPRKVMVGLKRFQFQETVVRRAIYATGWDGTVRVIARPQGTFTVYRQH